jgi:hypothetical protein
VKAYIKRNKNDAADAHHLQACRAEENHHRRPSKPATSYTRIDGPPQERQGSVARGEGPSGGVGSLSPCGAALT